MTDERIEKLAGALYGVPNYDSPSEQKYQLLHCRAVLAAIDADPEAYGYARREFHNVRVDGYCITCRTFGWFHDPKLVRT